MAHNGNSRPVVPDPPLLTEFDLTMADACRHMVRSLPRNPEPDWYFKQLGHSNFPGRMLGRMALMAHAAGAPLEDVETPALALLTFVRSLYGVRPEPDLRPLLVEETEAQGELDLIQMRLTDHCSDSELLQLRRAARVHRARLERLEQAATDALARRTALRRSTRTRMGIAR